MNFGVHHVFFLALQTWEELKGIGKGTWHIGKTACNVGKKYSSVGKLI